MGYNKKVLRAIDRELKDRHRSKRYSKSLSATNSLFAPNYLFSKPSKRRIYNPNAKYFKHGGPHDPPNVVTTDERLAELKAAYEAEAVRASEVMKNAHELGLKLGTNEDDNRYNYQPAKGYNYESFGDDYKLVPRKVQVGNTEDWNAIGMGFVNNPMGWINNLKRPSLRGDEYLMDWDNYTIDNEGNKQYEYMLDENGDPIPNRTRGKGCIGAMCGIYSTVGATNISDYKTGTGKIAKAGDPIFKQMSNAFWDADDEAALIAAGFEKIKEGDPITIGALARVLKIDEKGNRRHSHTAMVNALNEDGTAVDFNNLEGFIENPGGFDKGIRTSKPYSGYDLEYYNYIGDTKKLKKEYDDFLVEVEERRKNISRLPLIKPELIKRETSSGIPKIIKKETDNNPKKNKFFGNKRIKKHGGPNDPVPKYAPGGAYGPGDGIKKFLRDNNVQASVGYGKLPFHGSNYTPQFGLNTVLGSSRKGFWDLGATAGGDKNGFSGGIAGTYYGPFMSGNRHMQAKVNNELYYDQGALGYSGTAGWNFLGGNRNIGNRRDQSYRDGTWTVEGGPFLQVGVHNDLNEEAPTYLNEQLVGTPIWETGKKIQNTKWDFTPGADLEFKWKPKKLPLTFSASGRFGADLVESFDSGAAKGHQGETVYANEVNPDASPYTNAGQYQQVGAGIVAQQSESEAYKPEYKWDFGAKIIYDIDYNGGRSKSKKKIKELEENDPYYNPGVRNSQGSIEGVNEELDEQKHGGPYHPLPIDYLKSHGERDDEDNYQMKGFEKAVNQDLDSLLRGFNTDGYDSHWYGGKAEGYDITADQLRGFASENHPKSFVNAAAYAKAMNELSVNAGGKRNINIPFADNAMVMRTDADDLPVKEEYVAPQTLQEQGYINETGTNAVNQDKSYSTGLAKRYGRDMYDHLVEEQDGGPVVKQRRGVRENPDGTVSSHLMRAEYIPERGWVAFPSLFQDDDGTWVDMSEEENWEKILDEANKRSEVYEFGDDKFGALAFGMGSWKPENQNYNLKRALELGYEPDETGHWPSVDDQTGMFLKSMDHPTAFKEYMYGQLNKDIGTNSRVVVNPEGPFGDKQLQYVELTDEEAKEYRSGGYIVEEMHEGGSAHFHPHKDEDPTNPEYEYFDEAKQWVTDWHNSPMYSQMVLNSYNGNQGNADYLNKLRKKNIETLPELDIKEHPYKGPSVLPDSEMTAAHSLSKTGQIEMFPIGKGMGPTLYVHEILHSSDRPRELYKFGHPSYKTDKKYDETTVEERINFGNYTIDNEDNIVDYPDWMKYNDPRFPDEIEWRNRVMPVKDQRYINTHRGSNWKDNERYKLDEFNENDDIYKYATDEELTNLIVTSHDITPDDPSFAEYFEFYKKDNREEKDRWKKEDKDYYNNRSTGPRKKYWEEMAHNYISKPTEVRARLGEIRFFAQKEGIYDPFTEQITPEIFQNYINKERDDLMPMSPIQDLRQDFTDEEIIEMLNTISKNEETSNVLDDQYAKEGGSVELGDEVDKATMQRLKKQGYTFQEI